MQGIYLQILTLTLTLYTLLELAWTAQIIRPDCSKLPNGIYLPSGESCGRYFICMKGRPVSRQCNIGYAYDLDTKLCQPDSEVDCDLEERQEILIEFPTTTIPPITQPCYEITTPDEPEYTTQFENLDQHFYHGVSDCRNLDDGYILADPKNYRRYYRAQGGKCKRLSCPKQQVFDYIRRQCRLY